MLKIIVVYLKFNSLFLSLPPHFYLLDLATLPGGNGSAVARCQVGRS